MAKINDMAMAAQRVGGRAERQQLLDLVNP